MFTQDVSSEERGTSNQNRMREDFPEKGTIQIRIEIRLEVNGKVGQHKFLKREGGRQVGGRKRKRECIRVSFNFLMREPAR